MTQTPETQGGHINQWTRYLCELPPSRKANPAAQKNTAVRWAAEFGHVDVVRYLCELHVSRGVFPAAESNSALRFAARRGHLSVVRYL
jgi:ankyrin repeat protein